MLTDLFESASRIQALREGPSGSLLDAFAQVLVRCGYAPLTARRHLRSAEHFAHWADRQGMPVTGRMGPALERFRRHLQRGGRCRHFGHTFRLQILHGARLFLEHLQDVGVIEASAVDVDRGVAGHHFPRRRAPPEVARAAGGGAAIAVSGIDGAAGRTVPASC